MVKENFFEGKKNVVISFITIFLILVGVFFVSAYISGKNVTDDVRLQWVSHTEYWNNDDASSIIRLADYKGNAYSVDSCVVTILYPDKSVFVSEGVMSESNIDGNWYRTDSLIGAPLGTYEQEVVCVKGQQTVKSSQSFHLNPALEEVNTVSQNLNLLNDSLFVFDVEINGVLEDTNESIHTRVNVAENNLDAAIDLAQQNVLDELASHGVDSDASFSSLNATVLSRIDDLDVSFSDDLSSVNSSLNAFLVNMENTLSAQLTSTLEDLTNQLNAVKSDTEWIVSNTMDQTDRAAIDARFASVDSDLDKLLAFCGEVVPDANDLCQEIYGIRDAVAVLRAEQQAHFDTINETTYNTWQLLSGDITTNIDSILVSLNIIQDQNEEINDTTHQILDEIQGEIRANIIS